MPFVGGLAAGAIVGSALAAPAPYYYGPPVVYDAPAYAPVYVAPGGEDARYLISGNGETSAVETD